mmetsp:Transcript_26653/g.67777  ORF Transcript_26653/g.67777 Transcript_26653/m.67777 type:complete len:273 (-) Transcript_26653:533-1351(-)
MYAHPTRGPKRTPNSGEVMPQLVGCTQPKGMHYGTQRQRWRQLTPPCCQPSRCPRLRLLAAYGRRQKSSSPRRRGRHGSAQAPSACTRRRAAAPRLPPRAVRSSCSPRRDSWQTTRARHWHPQSQGRTRARRYTARESHATRRPCHSPRTQTTSAHRQRSAKRLPHRSASCSKIVRPPMRPPAASRRSWLRAPPRGTSRHTVAEARGPSLTMSSRPCQATQSRAADTHTVTCQRTPRTKLTLPMHLHPSSPSCHARPCPTAADPGSQTMRLP